MGGLGGIGGYGASFFQATFRCRPTVLAFQQGLPTRCHISELAWSWGLVFMRLMLLDSSAECGIRPRHCQTSLLHLLKTNRLHNPKRSVEFPKQCIKKHPRQFFRRGDPAVSAYMYGRPWNVIVTSRRCSHLNMGERSFPVPLCKINLQQRSTLRRSVFSILVADLKNCNVGDFPSPGPTSPKTVD